MNSSHRVRFFTSVVVLLCAAGAQMLRAAGPAGPAAGANKLVDLWDDLGSPDQAKARAAILKLAARGDSAVAFLAEKLNAENAPVNKERIAELIKDLDANNWRTREGAHKELARMGPAVLPALREVLQKNPSPEAKARAEAILAELDVQAAKSPAALRRSRAFVVLRRIASMRALEALAAVRPGAVGNDPLWIRAAKLNLAERALPRLVDAAGEKAGKGSYAAAAKLCGEALAIAEKADHYGKGRIRSILHYLRARQKVQEIPADLAAKLKAFGAGGKAGSIEPQIGWELVAGENLLGNRAFEVKRVQGIWPTAYGVWGGDMAEAVPAEQGVRPREGKNMLRFHHTNFRSGGSSTGCQVCQVVDVSKFKESIRAGRVRAFASAFFNRVTGNAKTDTALGVSLIAYSGSPARHFALSQSRTWVGQTAAGFQTDANPATWEKLAVSLRIPKDTDFLVIQLLAAEDVFNNLKGTEFDGHYADSAFVTLIADAADDTRGRE